MNFALVGYGKMGQTIEALGKRQGHSFPLIIDLNEQDQLNADNLKGIEAAIEFTVPSAAPDNIKKCIDLGIPVVCGTTGWNDRIPEVEAYCIEHGGTLFHASNFSVGVNILFALNTKLAGIMEQFPEYRPSLSEVHHVHKKDAPSGTAISLAEQILRANPAIKAWYLREGGSKEDPPAGQLPVVAHREGEVKGKHSVHYESSLDSITLSHEAHTRDAFAAGVLLAARFVRERKGVFGMRDLLKL